MRKGAELKIPISQKSIKLNASIDCTSKNIVYCIFCNKSGCDQIYVGQSQRELKQRFSEHKTSVRMHAKKVIGQHFNGPGHSIFNMVVAAIEQVFSKDKRTIEKRESMWIEYLEAEFKGLNQKQ